MREVVGRGAAVSLLHVSGTRLGRGCGLTVIEMCADTGVRVVQVDSAGVPATLRFVRIADPHRRCSHFDRTAGDRAARCET